MAYGPSLVINAPFNTINIALSNDLISTGDGWLSKMKKKSQQNNVKFNMGNYRDADDQHQKNQNFGVLVAEV